MNDATCGTCRYWVSYKPTLGDCRRYPPQVYPTEFERFREGEKTYLRVHEAWPETSPLEWCGEYAEVRHDPE